jgi:hypothetical protein
MRHVRLAYQAPANNTFLSEQTSHQYFSLTTNQCQPATSTFLLQQTSVSHQPNVQADIERGRGVLSSSKPYIL